MKSNKYVSPDESLSFIVRASAKVKDATSDTKYVSADQLPFAKTVTYMSFMLIF